MPSMEMLYVSACCPVGCGTPVVLLAARGTERVFCYCDLCGCVWRTPHEASFEAGLSDITPLEAFAPDGVELPTSVAVAAAGFAEAVIATLPVAVWGTTVDEINWTAARRPPSA